MNYGAKIWGSKAWHLLHSFSLNKVSKENKHNYYLFYSTFVYVLPCLVCSEHYADIFFVENTFEEKKIKEDYVKKWVFDTHNLVNEYLKKPIYNYQDFINNFKNINHEDNFFIIKNFILNIDFENVSLYKFDQINNFFINFCLLYPEIKRRNQLKKIINSENYNNISTPNEFKQWFKKNIILIENILINNEK